MLQPTLEQQCNEDGNQILSINYKPTNWEWLLMPKGTFQYIWTQLKPINVLSFTTLIHSNLVYTWRVDNNGRKAAKLYASW